MRSCSAQRRLAWGTLPPQRGTWRNPHLAVPKQSGVRDAEGWDDNTTRCLTIKKESGMSMKRRRKCGAVRCPPPRGRAFGRSFTLNRRARAHSYEYFWDTLSSLVGGSGEREACLTRGIELDSSRYPLVRMHAGTSYTQAEWHQLMNGMIALIQAGPFGLINDTRGSPMPDALQRRSIAEMYTNHEASVRRNFLASGIIGGSSLVNGVLTALNWLKPPPHAVKVFLSTEAAEDWVLTHFSAEMRARVSRASSTRPLAHPAS